MSSLRNRLLSAVVTTALAPVVIVPASVHASDSSTTAATSTAGAGGLGVAEPQMAAVVTDRTVVDKTLTSQAAESDLTLLSRTDSEMVDVIVKLRYDSVATYDGDIAGLAATSPVETGNQLTGTTDAEVAYEHYVELIEAQFATALATTVPAARIAGAPLRTVYGGVPVQAPAHQLAAIDALDIVVAVHDDDRRELLTDATADFVGATDVAIQAGGNGRAGAGSLVAVFDTGAWPEHPMLTDPGDLPAAPTQADGSALPCDFGDNPETEQVDPFVCNNKVVAGRVFLDQYMREGRFEPGEPFLDTARDGRGHGTHTATTALGSVVDSATVLGVERGPLAGIAPGAALAVYKVCGDVGCFTSDSVRAVEQAIRDGVDVINYSISGGSDPTTDPVELAFLDAYVAGVFVSTSAGNDGPDSGRVDHRSPWVTTVGATTQTRTFTSTLTVDGGGDTVSIEGSSVTAGVTTPTPIRLAGSIEGYGDAGCLTPAPAGSMDGLIVVCERGEIPRVEKSFNVGQGGAAGLVLVNVDTGGTVADNHWIPTVHIPAGTNLADLLASGDATATFTAGQVSTGRADVVAEFSSRGPGGPLIKPDLVAPGVAILAGSSPVSTDRGRGVPGQLWQVADGTSMAAPQVAGAAAVLASINPEWTAGQIKSALMTTAVTDLVSLPGSGRSNPHEAGAGRIDVAAAATPGLTFDVTPDDMIRFGSVRSADAVHLNVPSINAERVPGRLKTHRYATNVTGERLTYTARTTAPSGSKIIVTPSEFSIGPGETVELEIVIDSLAPTAQYFGEVALVPAAPSYPTLRMPVAFVPEQGDVTLTTICAPAGLRIGAESECRVTASNQSNETVTVDLAARVTNRLGILSTAGATGSNTLVRARGIQLPPGSGGAPTIGPGESLGYLALDGFFAPLSIGDEEIIDLDVPEFTYAGGEYDSIGISSNGFAVVGDSTNADAECCKEPVIPRSTAPNNVLAPFWTDLDGTGAPGVYAGVLSNGEDQFWFAVEWRVNVFGTDSERRFQLWIGLNGQEDVTFAYDADNLPLDPDGQPFAVGAEEATGLLGAALPTGQLPTENLRVATAAANSASTYSFTIKVRGLRRGVGVVATTMTASNVAGTTINRERVTVRPR